ncbi:sensor histidine kinase [Amycolatopsis lurida]
MTATARVPVTADRLRRLRWLLTALFTAVNAAGLLVFAWLFVEQDREQGELRMDGELRQVTAAVSRLVQRQADDSITTEFIQRDPVDTSCPEFAVLPAGTGRFGEYFSKQDCAPVDQARLHGLAQEAVASGRFIEGFVETTDGGLVRALAQPFQNPRGEYAGAIVTVIDATAELSRHQGVVLWVIGGCLLLVAAVGVGGHVLSGFVIRPAVRALEQEETLAIQPVRLDQLVTGLVRETPAGGAQVTVNAAPSKVLADPGLVRRAVGNLLDNALRHGRQPGAPAIVHLTVGGGSVTVADRGPGIDAAVAEETFNRAGGRGLSVVRWIAQAHDGFLRVYNAEEGGAIVELAFPLAE